MHSWTAALNTREGLTFTSGPDCLQFCTAYLSWWSAIVQSCCPSLGLPGGSNIGCACTSTNSACTSASAPHNNKNGMRRFYRSAAKASCARPLAPCINASSMQRTYAVTPRASTHSATSIPGIRFPTECVAVPWNPSPCGIHAANRHALPP